MSDPRRLTRRQFAKSAAAAAGSLTILPRHVLGGPGHTAPSDTLTKAIIGVGGMGRGHIRYPGSVLRAVCDVDGAHLRTALDLAGPGVAGYRDFREVLERPDIDIVHVATPPHWHALMSVAAAEAGKDVWCEKPMTRTIGEGRAVVGAIERTGRVFRVNTWFRFQDRFYGMGTDVAPIKKAVQGALLGWPIKATLSASTGFDWKFYWVGKTALPVEAVPPELDYDLWLGPAPWKPYSTHRVHGTFRGYWDYDGGGLGDMGMHYLDPVQSILGKDDTSPVEVWADGPQQHPDACGTWRRIEMKYADGCTIVLDGENKDKEAAFLEGPEGKIFRGFTSDIRGLEEKLLALPDPEPQVTDFSESVRTRRPFALNEKNGHRSCTLVNLGKAAVQLGRTLRYDPVKEVFAGDEEANRLVRQPMRSPWRLPLAVLLGVALTVPAAAQPAAAPGSVASILEGFPADSPAKRDARCAEILKLGPPAIERALAGVLPPGQGDDSRARFAVNGLAVYVTRPGAEKERAVFVRSLLASLGKAKDPGVATFLISQVQVAGKAESVRPLEKHLVDAALAGPASAALVTIGGKDATRALVNALGRAPSSVRPVLADALGGIRRREAVQALLPLADDADEATREAALHALANTADPAAGPVLARARLAASPRERAQAPSLYLLYARRLIEAGRTAEGAGAARAMLATHPHQPPGESPHAATALALLVSALGPGALSDLLAAAGSPDRALRGAALALAARIPGPEATARWIETARAASPAARAAIVAMLGARGDRTALPFVQESLDSRDASVRLVALPASARLGGDAVLPDLLEQVPAARGDEVPALRAALLTFPAERVVPEAKKRLGSTPLPGKALLVEVLAAKGARDAVDLAGLLTLLESSEGEDAARLREAIAATVRANPDAEHRAETILDRLEAATPAEKAAILGVLPKVGGMKAQKAILEAAASADVAVARAAVAALAQWPDSTAVADLRRIGSSTTDREQRVLAFEGFVRLMDGSRLPGQRRLAAFQQLLAAPGEDADRGVLLAGLAGVREPESLRLLAGYLGHPVLRGAAAAGLLELASRQAGSEHWLSGHEAYTVLRRVEESLDDPAAKERARAILLDRLRQGGYVPLFDGRSLAGWRGLVADPVKRAKMTPEELARAQAEADRRMRAHWRVVDDVLHFDGKGDSLCTERDYGDFELLVDWRIGPDGDSGLYLRGSPQVQIWDAGKNPVGSGGLFNNEKGPSKPLKVADRPVGEWNVFRVFMIGDRVTVYLNDERVVKDTVLESYWERDRPIDESGPIELQAHGHPLWFRDVFIRAIPRETAVPPVAEAEKAEGFVALFNGKDLEGWTGNLQGYAAEDGKIVVHPERAGGNLYTAKDYSDFVLRFELRLHPAANNGLGIRAPREGDAAYQGMELQILEDGSPVYRDLRPWQHHGSIYGVVAARRGALRPVGEWNTQQVTVQGRRVAVEVNGVTVVDADIDTASAGGTLDGRDHPGLARTSGAIGFLGHGDVVELRNIRIKETR